MIKQMVSLKFYIILIVTSVLALFHYPKYFQSPVWQDFTVADNQDKKDVSYSIDSTATIFSLKQKPKLNERFWGFFCFYFFTEFKCSI